MSSYHVLMGDIIRSHAYKATVLSRAFRRIVASCNEHLANDVLSPYTVTLGDEFQGVAASLESALRSIFYLEEGRLGTNVDFKLRYVLHFGKINTPLNREIAHGMMGPGLTMAREMLTSRRRGEPRFLFSLKDEMLTKQLTRLFRVLDSIVGVWRLKDYRLIRDMLANENNEEVGEKHGKNRSQIWKRRKHLRTTEYLLLKEAIFDLVQ